MKTVIMAGGKGTRISSLAASIPKPMITIEGKPVLEHEITCLKSQGYTDIIITISHLGSVIMNYFGDGRRLGVNIQYFYEKTPLGNGGALYMLRDSLDDDFLLLNADTVFDVDFNRFVEYHKKKKGLVTLFTHPNSHPYDSGVLITDRDGSVTQWLTKEDERPRWYKNRVNAGLHVLNPSVLDMTRIDPHMIGKEVEGRTNKIDLDRQILKPMCGTGKMFCYDSPEYVKDMGTPDRYEMVRKDYAMGVVQSKNLKRKQRAIFLDRDGTINKYVGFLRNINDFELLPGVVDAIKKINDSRYLAIVVTNQPVVARGEITVDELEKIHNKLETLLGEQGAYLDAIYYCPHHPHSGFEGEIKSLKINCDCRKPKPGMLLKAANDFNIDVSKSWIIGDSESDIKAGQNAGCKTALIGESNYGQNVAANSLSSAIDRILSIDN